MRRMGQNYSGREKNDFRKAVDILHDFMNAYCINAEVDDDLEFMCNECPFRDGEDCRMKMFKNKYAPDYVDFSSMGDL